MSKFQQHTAVMKFFRDLRDEQVLKQQRFEQDQASQRPADLSQTVFTYDIRKEPVLTLKDAADRNLLYNITQFLLDSRASLASRLEEQRVRQSLPEGADFFRVCMDLEGVMNHFNVRRPMKHRRAKSSSSSVWSTSASASSSSPKGASQTNQNEPTSPALSEARSLSPLGGVKAFVPSSAQQSAALDLEDGYAVGIDQQTFVEVFTEVLRQEADRIVNHEGDILSTSVTSAMAAAAQQSRMNVDANETTRGGAALPELQTTMSSLPSPKRQQLPPRASGAAAGRRASSAAAAAAAITFSGVFVSEETTADGVDEGKDGGGSGPSSQQTSPTRSAHFAGDVADGGQRVDSFVTQRKALSSRSLSMVGGRTERRMLMRLFDEMDVDSCGVVSWDGMIAYMTRTRVGGQDRIEEQREGQLCLTANDGAEPIRVGSGKAATAASVQYVPELDAVLVIYERVVEASHGNEGGGGHADAKGNPPRRAPHRANMQSDDEHNSSSAVKDGDADGHKVLELYSTQDHRLMHRRLMPPSTSVVLYLPFVEDSGSKKQSSEQNKKSSSSSSGGGGGGGGGGFFGSFMSSGSFQAFRMQIQLARGTIDLIPSHNPIQLGGTHAPAYAQYNHLTNLVYCASLHGTLFAYDPQALARPMRISSPQRMHHVFEEPITCMIHSPDATKVFLSCLFGGIALYQPVKDMVTHKFTATYGNRKEACGIRTMEYIAESNILITAGPASSIEVWMATPCRGVDPHICTLEHESDPHRHEIMYVWVDPSVSDRSVASLDKSGVMKLWDVSRGLVLGSFTVGDGLGYHVFAAAAATKVKGTLYYVGNSTRTHRCFLDSIVMRRKMVNPVAVAKSNGVQHQRHCKLIRGEEQVLSAVDGTIITYDVKTGRMLQFFPDVFQCESKRISAMAAAAVSTAKKAFVATEDGDITTFCLLSGERRLILKPFRNKLYEVTGLVYFDTQRILVAACKYRDGHSTQQQRESMQDPAIRVYVIPERDPPKGETEHELDFMCEITVPGKRGVVAMCERVHPTSTVCGLVVLWDTMGYMHQLSVEGSRVMLSTAIDAPRISQPPKNNKSSPPQQLRSNTSSSSRDGDDEGIEDQLLSAAEINFASETTILTLLEGTVQDAMREVKCGVDLSPFPFVASSDSASQIHLWTAAPMDLFRVKSWEHFSPRKVVAGVNKAVVTALAFAPSPGRLIAADDHGCVSVWDVTRFLEAACGGGESNVPSFGDAVFRGPLALGRQGNAGGTPSMPTFRMADVEQLFGTVEIPLVHCFHICPNHAPAEPLISIEVMATRDAYCVGMSRGSTRFVSMTGSVVGELYAEPKFMIEDPPKYFLDKISEVEEMKKPKKRTRAGELWAKLRQSLLGDGRVLMMGVKELLSRARNAVDLASKNQGDDDHSDEDGPPLSPRGKRRKATRNEDDASDDDEDDDDDGGAFAAGGSMPSSSSSSKPNRRGQGRFPCYVTPCNTPTEVRDVMNTLRVPTDARYTECLIDPLRSDTNRHPALKAMPIRGWGGRGGSEASEDLLGESVAASSFGRPSQDEFDPTMRVLLGVKKTLERLVERVVVSKQKQSPPTGMRVALTTATTSAGSSNHNQSSVVTSTSLSKCYNMPPPLFAPSVFKALRRPELVLPPPEDRPMVIAPWIEGWVRALSQVHSLTPHLDHSRQQGQPVNSADVVMLEWSSHLVPQHTMPLQVLHLPNHLAVKYWNKVDEDDTVPQLKLKGCVEQGPAVTPMPTHRRSTVATARTHVSAAGDTQYHNHSARSSSSHVVTARTHVSAAGDTQYHNHSARSSSSYVVLSAREEEGVAPTVAPREHSQPQIEEESARPLHKPLSALRRKLRDIPTSLADSLVVGTQKAVMSTAHHHHRNNNDTPNPADALPLPQAMLEMLLHASAPLYPLQESPFLNPGRAPPALSPALFFPIGHVEGEGQRQNGDNDSMMTAPLDLTTAPHGADVSIPRSMLGSRQQRPTSSSSSIGGRPRSSNSATSTLGRAMSAVRHSTSMLHPNFMQSAIAVAVSHDALADVVTQHRSWDGRAREARTFASQFSHDTKRQQGGAGGAAGKLAKLRLGGQHTNIHKQLVNVGLRREENRDDDAGGFATRPVAMIH
ncbi:Hypothetical protein, putative, partial [Bodo saltans]